MIFSLGKKLTKNIEIAAAAMFSQNPRLENIGKKMMECSNRLEVFVDSSNNMKIATWRCKSSLCSLCSRVTFLDVFERLGQIDYEDGNLYRAVHLTIRSCDLKDLRVNIQKLNNSFDKLKRSVFMKPFTVGVYKKVEWNVGKYISRRVNPHLHCIWSFQTKNLMKDKKWLRNVERLTEIVSKDIYWLRKGFYSQRIFSLIVQKYGFGPICWINEIKDSEKTKKEFTKYVTKSFQIKPQYIDEYFQQTLNIRTFSFSGSFRAFKSNFVFEPDDNPDLTYLCKVEEFGKFTYENPNYFNAKFLDVLVKNGLLQNQE